MLGKYYKILLHNKRCFTGVLIAVDKKLNISIANSEEIISEDKYKKCVNFDCYLCRTSAKKWGIVNILGKDILEIDEIE